MTPRAVTGLERNSVTPASRASATRRMVEWPVIMITGTIGLGLSWPLRSRLTKSMPSSGCIARSVITTSMGFLRSVCRASAPLAASNTSLTPIARRISVSSSRMWWLSSTSRIFNSSKRKIAPHPSQSRRRTDRRDDITRVSKTNGYDAPRQKFSGVCAKTPPSIRAAAGPSTALPGWLRTGAKRAAAGLAAVAQEGVGQHAGHHRLDDRAGAQTDAGIVATGGAHLHPLARLVQRTLRRQDRRGRLERHPRGHRRARGDAAEDAAGLVGEEPRLAVGADLHLVGVLLARQRRSREARPDLDPLGGVDRHQRASQLGVELAIDRRAPARRHAGSLHRDDRAGRRPRLAGGVEVLLPDLDHRRIGAPERVSPDLVPVPLGGVDRMRTDLRDAGAHGDALAEDLAGDGARRHARRGLAGRLPASAAIIANAILGEVGVVGVARPALVEPDLDVGLGQRDARRAAVDHAPQRRPMALAPGGDAEQMAEGVVRHGGGFLAQASRRAKGVRLGRPGGGELAQLAARGAFGRAGVGDQADEEAALRVAAARRQALALKADEAALGDLAADPQHLL